MRNPPTALLPPAAGDGRRAARAAGAASIALVCLALASGDRARAQSDTQELFLGGQPATPRAGETAPPDATPTARGVVEPGHEAVISSELAARIFELPFEEGESFAAGDTLVAFDCALFEARRRQAVAQLQAARAKLRNAEQLQATNAIGAVEVDLAAAEARRTAAAVAETDVAVARCSIAAPFDGRVVERLRNPHEVAAPGDELLAIVSRGAPETTLLVPSDWLVWLQPGQDFEFRVDETGMSLPGRILRLGARIDPVSQTVPVYGSLVAPASQAPLVPGMSGTARFPEPAPRSSGQKDRSRGDG